MSHLGMKDLLSSQDEPDIISDDIYEKGQWRLRLFHSCQSIEGFHKGNLIEEVDDIKFGIYLYIYICFIRAKLTYNKITIRID
jgi:hypothetical protein